jgi:uncharacterized delta-60 repeat protein
MSGAAKPLSRLLWLVALAWLALLAPLPSSASTFGVNGIAIPPIYVPGGDASVTAVLRQSDGKLIVAGSAEGPLGTTMFAARFSSAGVLDAGYGVGGIAYVPLPVGAQSLLGAAAVLDSLGNVVIAGKLAYPDALVSPTMAVARLTTTGAPDAAFGTGGLKEITFPGYNQGSFATSAAVDSAGRILIGGGATDIVLGGDMAVARLTAAGALDPSFNGGGTVVINFASYTSASAVAVGPADSVFVAGPDFASAIPLAISKLTSAGQLDLSYNGTGTTHVALFGPIAADASGRVLVAQDAYVAGVETLQMTRVTGAGAVDAGFGSGGIGQLALTGLISSVWVHQLTIDHSGRPVVGVTGYVSSVAAIGVVRFTATGAGDSGFNGSGVQTVSAAGFFGGTSVPAAITVDPGDNVIVAGPHFDPNSTLFANDVLIARFTSAGAIDSSFAGTGSTIRNCGVLPTVAEAMIRQPDGKFVLAGRLGSDPNSSFLVARLTTTGALDPSFNGTGFRIIQTSPGGGGAWAAALDAGNNIVLAGVDSYTNLALARVTSAGAMDASFNGTGIVILANVVAQITAPQVTIDHSGNILAVAQAPYPTAGFSILRLTPTGSLDPAFGAGGIASVALGPGPPSSEPHGIKVDSSNRIVVGGWASVQGSPTFVAVRLTSLGALDASFGGTGVVFVPPQGNSYFAEAYDTGVDGSDRVLLAGIGSSAPEVARLTVTGQPDLSFNGTGAYFGSFDSNFASRALTFDSTGRIVVSPMAICPLPPTRRSTPARACMS